ncbi:MAG: hypothetical protein HYW86_04225 [Candidatus Roizmanbacteria bacterium]|nr:MAG: hypothetical protein HYW86_04225 [Candidatus Roizmanbacteria bacterium]
MRQFSPVASLKDIQIVYAEDSVHVYPKIIAGMRHLIGIPKENITHFLQLDAAAKFLEKKMDRPTFVILDNTTSPSKTRGLELAKSLLERKSEFPNLNLVTVSSNEINFPHFGEGKYLKDLQDLGGEYWFKGNDGNIMLLWLGECMRTGQVIPRAEWLSNLGLESSYPKVDRRNLIEDSIIYELCDRLVNAPNDEEVAQILKGKKMSSQIDLEIGDFFNLPSKEVITRLGVPPRGIEGQPHPSKES